MTPRLPACLSGLSVANVRPALQVNNQIYPVWTYSYLGFLSVVGPLTEAIGYKRAILLNALAVLATRTILIYGTVRWVGVPAT